MKTTPSKNHYQYTLNRGLQELKGLKNFISEMGLKHNLKQELTSHIKLCVEELIVNIVSYGFQKGGQPKIKLSIQILNTHIHLCLTDNGKPFNPTLWPRARVRKKPQSLKDLKPGGLGLTLVRGFMDHIHYSHQEGWNKLTLKKQIKNLSPGKTNNPLKSP